MACDNPEGSLLSGFRGSVVLGAAWWFARAATPLPAARRLGRWHPTSRLREATGLYAGESDCRTPINILRPAAARGGFGSPFEGCHAEIQEAIPSI